MRSGVSSISARDGMTLFDIAVDPPALWAEQRLGGWPGSAAGICANTWERLEKSSCARVEIYRYPNARHTFDQQSLSSLRQGPQGSVGYNSESAVLAWTRTMEFLGKTIGLRIATNPVR